MNRTAVMTSTSPDRLRKPASSTRVQAWRRFSRHRQAAVLPVLFVLSLTAFSLYAPGFLSADNLVNVSRQSVYLLIVSLAQLVVLIGGGLDLSVGTVVALTSVVGATLMTQLATVLPDAPWFAIGAGCAGGMVVGALVGLVNGLGTALLRIPSFMMTLGMSSVVFGLTLLVSAGVPIQGLPPVFGETFGFGRFAGLPVPSLIALAAVAAIYLLLEWTRFGRHLYATGGNARAAELSGVRTTRVTVIAFAIAGALSSLAGLLLTARLDSGESNIGASLPLESIAACVIAGVSLAGGAGRTIAVVVGTLLIVLVQNGMNLMQVGAYAQMIAIGSILIFAMALARR